ncbi:MAG: DUF4279 domain-containing protein [Geminicoccaceae bacterium]
MIIKSSATLRVMSDSLSAAEMTEILGVAPGKSFEKGDLVSPKSPKPTYRKAAMWQWESEIGETKSLNMHLLEICRFLKEREGKLHLLVGCQMDVFCGVFSDGEQIGFDIDHNVIKALTDFPVDLVFDAYGDYSD